MPAATAAPPSTPSAPPSVKSFWTSTISSARVMLLIFPEFRRCQSPGEAKGSAVREAVPARPHVGGERVERLLRGWADVPERVEREGERRPVLRPDDARQRVAGVDPTGLRPHLAVGARGGAGEPVAVGQRTGA